MFVQSGKPPKFVVEPWARHRITVWQVKRCDAQATYVSFQVATMAIFGIAGQRTMKLVGLGPFGQDRHPVPADLAVPQDTVTGRAKRIGRETLLRDFQFL